MVTDANKSPIHLLFLACLCAVIVFSYSTFLEDNYATDAGSSFNFDEMYKPSAKQFSTARRLNIEEERLLEVIKDTWPECVEQKMEANQCKLFIDEQILTLFTGQDQFIQTHIVEKRKTADEWYNCIAIKMDDNDLTLGRSGDGLVYYEFEWVGSGVAATPEQQTEIPPITAVETPSGAVEGNLVETIYATPGTTTTTGATEPQAIIPALTDPPEALATTPGSTTTVFTTTVTTTTVEPFDYVETPLNLVDASLVEGATIDDVISAIINGTDTNPINGGVILDPNAKNTLEGDQKLEDALSVDPIIADPGPRMLGDLELSVPAFDCAGMTGFSCCLKIKHSVRDADVNGKGIQCFLDYEESTCKKEWWRDIVGKKRVMIYANHNKRVSKAPKIEGSWPSCNEAWGVTRNWGSKSSKSAKYADDGTAALARRRNRRLMA